MHLASHNDIKKRCKPKCSLRLLRLLTSEFLACFLLQFVYLVLYLTIDSKILACLAHNLLYASIIQIFVPIGAGIISPALTLAILIDGRIGLSEFFLFVFIQPLGVIIGNCAYLSFEMIENFDALKPIFPISSNYSLSFLCLIIALATVLFTLCWLSVIPKNSRENISGVPIFCVLAANSLWAGNLTGSSMNPANEIFTVLMLSGAENGSKIWIYIVGPFGGAIIGALFYRFVLRQENLPPGQNRTFEIERISQPPSRTPLLSQSPV